jgi:GT2 family glycosyltransferase
MTNVPAVLVIIVTWNKKEYVIELLDSLEDLAYPREAMDILVVDNASSDGTVKALRERFDDIRIIANTENLGGCGGFNTGLAFAFEQPPQRYDYLWLLDNDVLVQKNTLSALVEILQENRDVAIAGSTMMQLTSPWCINEMGAFVDRGRGTLILNRHRDEVPAFQAKSLSELLTGDVDLTQHLEHCRSWMDVDYVAAASLLVRADVARSAGLWDDYFIHFDDVEWCLRIAGMGNRIAVSAKSLIWHLPADYKIPTWILYYDNRNVLAMLEKHSDRQAVRGTRNFILKKSLYYKLLGKNDLADLILQAVMDFDRGRTGKKNIQLDDCYKSLDQVESYLQDPEIRRVLLPWTVNLQACDLQRTMARVLKERQDLQIDYILPATFLEDVPTIQVPGTVPLRLPDNKVLRMYSYMRMRGRYDLVFQSEYQQILPLSWLGGKLLFVHYEGISLRMSPGFGDIWQHVRTLIRNR